MSNHSSDPLDWPMLLRLGLGHLGLHPDQFWVLTPAELWLMLGAPETAAHMDRAGLARLMQAFPDEHEARQEVPHGRGRV